MYAAFSLYDTLNREVGRPDSILSPRRLAPPASVVYYDGAGQRHNVAISDCLPEPRTWPVGTILRYPKVAKSRFLVVGTSAEGHTLIIPMPAWEGDTVLMLPSEYSGEYVEAEPDEKEDRFASDDDET